MFKFSTTTIVNQDTDYRSEKALFSSIAADDKHGAILKIKRDFTFEMPGITKVYKKVASKPTYAELTVDCDKLIAALPSDTVYPVTGRIGIYVSLEGSEESVFANDFYQKGLPFTIGYAIKNADVTGTELAAQIVKNIVKYNVNTVGRRLFDAEANAAVVDLKATDEYERFKAFAVLIDEGHQETELVHLFDGELDNDQDIVTLVSRGVNGFGTFRHLLKDLRLPTAANTNWTPINPTERPIPGALYNQYIIYYAAPSETNPSLVSVGHETVSKTTHVFWVNQNISDNFEAVIAEVVGSAAVADDDTAIFQEV